MLKKIPLKIKWAVLCKKDLFSVQMFMNAIFESLSYETYWSI
jgi:hypothetical protein